MTEPTMSALYHMEGFVEAYILDGKGEVWERHLVLYNEKTCDNPRDHFINNNYVFFLGFQTMERLGLQETISQLECCHLKQKWENIIKEREERLEATREARRAQGEKLKKEMEEMLNGR